MRKEGSGERKGFLVMACVCGTLCWTALCLDMDLAVIILAAATIGFVWGSEKKDNKATP